MQSPTVYFSYPNYVISQLRSSLRRLKDYLFHIKHWKYANFKVKYLQNYARTQKSNCTIVYSVQNYVGLK